MDPANLLQDPRRAARSTRAHLGRLARSVGRGLARWAGSAGRNLQRALWRGPDEPPPIRPGRPQLGQTIMAAVLVLAVVLALLGSQIWHAHLLVGNPWWPVAVVLSGGLLLVAFFHPLLAWRAAWLVLLYELTMRGALLVPADGSDPSMVYSGWQLEWLPPLVVSEVQVVAFLAVLFLVAASQPRGVVCWIWLFTGTMVWLIPVGWTQDLANVLNNSLWISTVGGWLNYVSVPEFVYAPAQDDDGYIWGHSLIPDALAVQVGGVLMVTAVVLAGQLARRLARNRRRLAAAQERELVLAERARIARELHDVIAHHMSTVAVRAETAPYRLQAPPAATEEFLRISDESRSALTEMRRLLGVLRSDESPAPTAPQPGLTDLADLLDAVRAVGTPVRATIHGAMTGLPSTVDVSAYRIVQEALTNAARHAVGAPVHVSLRRTGNALVVSVRNGPGEPSVPGGAAGHGVRGMRERAAALGGTLTAEPTAAGGFEVSAILPLEGSAGLDGTVDPETGGGRSGGSGEDGAGEGRADS